MKKDIVNRADIIQIVDVFYGKVRADALIGKYFTTVMPVNWDTHLPIMYNFWENVLFHTGNFEGNPMAKHRVVHGLQAIGKDAFEQWVRIFCQTVDELYSGPNADTIKIRAKNIAMIMDSQLNPE
jgi:hemoglobin